MQYVLYVIGFCLIWDGLASGAYSREMHIRNMFVLVLGMVVFGAGLFLRYRGLQ